MNVIAAYTKRFRRLCPSLLLALCLLLPAAAQKKDLNFHLSFEPYISGVYGEVGEYVFQKDDDGDYYQLSYLEWEEKPRWEYGLRINGSYKRLFVNLYLASSLSEECGEMKDSDWLNTTDTDIKTNYSISDNKVSSYLSYGGRIGFSFQPWEKLSLMPVVEVGYYNLLFKAYDGEGWYGTNTTTFSSWDSPDATHFTMQGNIIDYDQWSVYTYLGCGATFTPIKRLGLELYLAASPYSYTESKDIHRLRSLKFKDVNHSVFKRFKGSATARYSFNDTFTLGLSVDGLIGLLDKGDTYYTTEKSDSYTKISGEKGGISLREANVSLFLRLYLF